MANLNYTVEEPKEQVRKLSPAGNVLVYYRIWATSKKGTRFSIEVPEDAITKAPDLLAARATALDAI